MSKYFITQTIISDLFTCRDDISSDELFAAFEDLFLARLREEAGDPDVVAFKSAICYRTGLAIDPAVVREAAIQSLGSVRTSHGPSKPVRLQHKSLNDWIVVKTAEVAAQATIPGTNIIFEAIRLFDAQSLAVQFHTGLGDNDLQLSLATPSLMQPLIHAHPNTSFVLLHASYPFTREAGYLASVYPNVYIDFGEVGYRILVAC